MEPGYNSDCIIQCSWYSCRSDGKYQSGVKRFLAWFYSHYSKALGRDFRPDYRSLIRQRKNKVGSQTSFYIIRRHFSCNIFVLIWWIPKGEAVQQWFGSEDSFHVFQLSYILIALLLFYTATTIFEIPHGALGMEMTTEYHERTKLFSAKSFSVIFLP